MQQNTANPDIQPETSTLELTASQTNLLRQAQGAAQQANERLNLVITAIFAGKDIDNAEVLGFEGNTLTYRQTPDKE